MIFQIHDPLKKETASITNAPKAIALGIDLGTTHSVVAYAADQKPMVISSKNDSGDHLVPSVVAYLPGNKVLTGKEALRLAEGNPEIVYSSFKRQMPSGSPLAIRASAAILSALKKRAELFFGHAVTEAVITVPAYFDDRARHSTKEAAAQAGLTVLRLINEPTAAALAYGLDQGVEGLYVIYDMGGGTFDISILRLTKGVFQVLATGGDTALGGDDMDQAILEHLQEKGCSLGLSAARTAKESLTTHESIDVSEGIQLSREDLAKAIRPIIEASLGICHGVMIDAEIDRQDIQGVVLVGGTTRIPMLQAAVADFFGQQPLGNIDPDLVVAQGAALQAEALVRGSNTLLLDVCPLSLGLETYGGLVEKVIPRNTPLPARLSQDFTTAEDGQTRLQINVLQGEREKVSDCRSLGQFILTDIPPLRAGGARITVTFALDADGLLTVSAQEKSTLVSQELSVKPQYGLSEDDMIQALTDSARHGAEDMRYRLHLETCLKSERLLKTLEHFLETDSDLLSSEELSDLKEAMSILRDLVKTADRDTIRQHYMQVELMSRPLAERQVERALERELL